MFINVEVTLTWNTQIELPDRLSDSDEALDIAILDTENEWDFTDGGLGIVGVSACMVDEDGEEIGDCWEVS